MKAGRKRKFRPPVEHGFIAAGLYHFVRQDPADSTHPLLAVLRSVAAKLTRKELQALRDAFDGVNADGSSLIDEQAEP
jgi:hypothetical protein